MFENFNFTSKKVEGEKERKKEKMSNYIRRREDHKIDSKQQGKLGKEERS